MDTTTSSTLPGWADGLALRWQRAHFRVRAAGLQLARACHDTLSSVWRGPFPRPEARRRVDDPVTPLAFVRATSVSRLWTQGDAREWRLTAGKLHNLRVAARALDGLVLPAHAVFSFWAAVGRPSARRGFVPGRELREGCLVTSTGGGLCQLSNALYDVALQAGARIVERHAHSRVVPGSQAAAGRDATVFWNYLDLRFSLPEPCELEVRLDHQHLVVRLRSLSPSRRPVAGAPPEPMPRSTAVRDCADCTRTHCPGRFVATPGQGRTFAAVPASWPEHLAWTCERTGASTPPLRAEDVTGWRVHAARVLAWLSRRHAPAWRRSVLAVHDARARAWAATLPHDCDELVVPLDWLAALACDGALQGRRYRVLMTRPPLAWLHQELDDAAARQPKASLGEYRASRPRVALEMHALHDATRLVTPHAALADRLQAQWPGKLIRLEWQPPAPAPATARGRRVLLPAPALARSGAVELLEACQALGLGLDVLGTAHETSIAIDGGQVRVADSHDPWHDVGVVAWPSWVSVAPRRLLEALARGIPVVATRACGLPPGTPGVRWVPAGDEAALVRAVASAWAREDEVLSPRA